MPHPQGTSSLSRCSPNPLSGLLKRHSRLLLCLFFAFWLVLGLVTTPQYGQPWDEPEEMDILRMHLWEYAEAFHLDTAAFEGLKDGTNTAVGGRLPYTMSPISQSTERDHGECAYYPLAGIMMSSMPPATRSLIWHGYTWCLFWLGAVALYHVCRHLGLSRGIGCLAVVMLMLTPRFFAEGHYNSKDTVLFAFTLLVLWQALRLSKKPSLPTGLLFALMGALAAGTKIVGVVLFGLCGLFVIARLAASKRLTPKALGVGGATLVAFLLCYFLLTPASWTNPIAFLEYLFTNATAFSRWGGLLLFRGMVFDPATQAIPWYYLPYMIFATTPLWMLFFWGVGQLVALRRLFAKGTPPERRLPLLLCTLLWLVPFLTALLTHALLYNGWRHFYFLYAPMLVLAAYGLDWLWAKVRQRKGLQKLMAVLLALGMGFTGIGMILNHPYQYVYYNPLVSLRVSGSYLERDYWNVSVKNALDALAKTPAVMLHSAPCGIAGVDLWAQQGVERTLLSSPLAGGVFLPMPPNAPQAEYLLVNHTYQNMSGWQPKGLAIEPVVQISAYERPLVTIYRRVASPEEVAQ